jgi:hypothetical protein
VFFLDDLCQDKGDEMNDFFKKWQIFSRTEMAILRINIQTASKQIILFSVGIVLILLAVAMFNVGMYMSLSENFGRDVGAFIVSAFNGALAVIIMLIANRTKPGPEAAMAKEIRDLALTEINADVDKFRQNLNEVKTDVQRIRSGFGGLLGGGDKSALGLLRLAPLFDVLISSLRKSKQS